MQIEMLLCFCVNEVLVVEICEIKFHQQTWKHNWSLVITAMFLLIIMIKGVPLVSIMVLCISVF